MLLLAKASGGTSGGGGTGDMTKAVYDPANKSEQILTVGDSSSFATSTQGGLADTAVQPADLSTVATTGDYSDLSNKPDLSVYDEVEQHADLESFPATGNTIKFYLAQDTGIMYRWTGSTYVVISGKLALGETSETAYRGDRGKIAYDHTSSTNNPHSVTKAQVGLANADNTSDANKPVSVATQAALDGKADSLGVDDNYVTDAEKVVIGNTSGTNTGDQDISGIATNAAAITNKQDIIAEGAFADGDKTKLDSIAVAATANDTDANLKNRANHTGTQTASTISDFDTEVANNSAVALNTAKIGITPTQSADITINNSKISYTDSAAVSLNTAKVTNATHTGDVTGSTALTIASTAISGKSSATLVGTEEVLINDAGTLKKATAQDIADLGGGGGVAPSKVVIARKTSNQSTNSTTYQKITFNAEDRDTNSEFSSNTYTASGDGFRRFVLTTVLNINNISGAGYLTVKHNNVEKNWLVSKNDNGSERDATTLIYEDNLLDGDTVDFYIKSSSSSYSTYVRCFFVDTTLQVIHYS